MTQPPDDRRPMPWEPNPDPDGPPEEPPSVPPPDPPTVAWTPPKPPSGPPPSEGGVGWAAMPDEPAAATPAADEPAAATPAAPTPPADEPAAATPAADTPDPLTPTPAAPAPSPIISASPADATPPASGWTQPGAPAAPVVGWELPAPPEAAPNREGYVIAGVGARLVAWFIDILLVSIVPGALAFFLLDYGGLFREAMEAAAAGQTRSTFTVPVTLDLVLVTLISLAIQFLYFVGFWTSGSRATPGMRGLKMQVVDAPTGGTLSLGQAIRRWAALGWPLALLSLVTALQVASGLVQFALTVILFLTTVANDRRQGLHDKFAGSLVIRSVTSGDAATAIGCIVFGVLFIGITIIGASLFLAAVGPELEQLLIDIGNSI